MIVVKEIAHVFHKSKKGKNIMALKLDDLDLTKVYDSLEWNFIHHTLISFNFPLSFIKLIMCCITTPQISVFWNGEITPEFFPSRGIRQGDPLSSYIFVLCLDKLSTLIENQVRLGCWKPLRLTKNISLSHVFYADDVFLFGHTSAENMTNIMDTLNSFSYMSGLRINMDKYSIIFPTRMSHILRHSIADPFKNNILTLGK